MQKYWMAVWMEAKNQQTSVWQSEAGGKKKAADMSELWGIAELFEFKQGETDMEKFLQKWTYGKGLLIRQNDPPTGQEGIGGLENKLKPADDVNVPASKQEAKKAPVKSNTTKETETMATEANNTATETKAAAKKAPAAKKAAPAKAPAKKAAAKAPAAKKAAGKAPAKAPAKKAAAAKKEAAPKKDAKPYSGPHPEFYNAMKLRDGSKTAKVAVALLKSLDSPVKMSKLQEAVYGSADAEGADGITMRINCVKAAITANKVKLELKGDRKTKDKEATVGLFTK
jgi:hypothetical protein